MKKLLLLGLVFFIGCTPNTDVAFYEFNEEDYAFLPTVYENTQQAVFRNQLDEEITIKVFRYAISKERVGGISLSGNSSPLVDVNKLLLDFTVEGDHCSKFYLSFYKRESTVYSRFDLATGGVPCEIREVFQFETPYSNLQNMSIGNKIYDKVLIIETQNPSSFSQNYNLTKLYFDLKFGFIGFDDTQNNINYRIVN
ncbi:MAG: hypothetical protein R2776_04960 [Flavobacteriaceae bacterium]